MWDSNEKVVLSDTLKITIIGSSVSLRIRPNLPAGEGLNFGQIVEQSLASDKQVLVTNLGLSRMLITEIDYNLDQYIRTFPDLFIINIGAVDAPNREIPRWFSNYIFKRKSRTSFKFFNWFHKKIIKRVRTVLVRIRMRSPWVTSKSFLQNFDSVITTLQKETNARIIVLGINNGNENIDRVLPGSSKNYIKYNDNLKSLARNKGVQFLDVSNLISNEYFPDGVHYNQEGHEIIAKRIIELWHKAE